MATVDNSPYLWRFVLVYFRDSWAVQDKKTGYLAPAGPYDTALSMLRDLNNKVVPVNDHGWLNPKDGKAV